MEWTKGNPDLKPSHDMEHRLQFSYNNNRLQAFVAQRFFLVFLIDELLQGYLDLAG